MQYVIILPIGGDSMYSRLRDLREDNDMKQRELACYLNCSQQVYSNYELGQRDIPTDILIKLSKLYNVSIDYILGVTNNPKRNI
jgi:transcriptional regulator with XRE-family HTH domain